MNQRKTFSHLSSSSSSSTGLFATQVQRMMERRQRLAQSISRGPLWPSCWFFLVSLLLVLPLSKPPLFLEQP